MQRKFLKPMIEKLEASIKNMELNRLYLDNQLRQELEELKAMATNNNVNLNPLSVSEQFDLVDAKTKLANLDSIEKHITSVIPVLASIMGSYKRVCEDIAKEKNKKVTNVQHLQQLKLFRDFLRKFGYTSNHIDKVFFKEESCNYKYFPVVQYSEDIEEEIRSDSSASDFIRSIWSYYITLLSLGVRHPGILVMDEPCQHSMKESSLKSLFEECAKLTDKQVILFCSSQPHTEETPNRSGQSSNIIKQLVESIHDVTVNFLNIEPRAIDLIE